MAKRKPKKYFSVDIEATGKYPWNSSMLSFGACVVDGKFDKTFYAEIKPIRGDHVLENFKIGASALEILKGYNFKKFNPWEVMRILLTRGEDPGNAIKRFEKWIEKNSKGFEPVIAAAPIKFDGMFISYYMDRFSKNGDPFKHSGEDINSVFRGSVKDINANIRELSMRSAEGLRHNALSDAIQEAKEFWVSLVHMRQHRK